MGWLKEARQNGETFGKGGFMFGRGGFWAGGHNTTTRSETDVTYDERRVYSDGAGCQHGTEVYRHEPYRHYCMDCGADLDEIMDLVGLQADLEELEKTDAIVKAAATSYANMVARVTGAQPDAELSEHERLTRALDAAQVCSGIFESVESTRPTLESARVVVETLRDENRALLEQVRALTAANEDLNAELISLRRSLLDERDREGCE